MSRSQLPPGQQLAVPGKWPTVGERTPRESNEPWTIAVGGQVAKPRVWTLHELRSLPQTELVTDIHCVTRWSKLGVSFQGVTLASLLEFSRAAHSAKYASFVARSERSHSTSLELPDALNLQTLIALSCDGEPLPTTRGGPVRTIVPGRYFYKSLKWLEKIELLQDDRLGYWEATAGYHNRADPWREERYVATGISKQEAARLISQRDFSGRDLRGLDASNRDLPGLNARDALLRNADFSLCRLAGACFEHANLSNAHLAGADLRGASFLQADVEGADFTAADLRGADFRGASLLGTTFCQVSPQGEPLFASGAVMDDETRFDRQALELLSPPQFAYSRYHGEGLRPGDSEATS